MCVPVLGSHPSNSTVVTAEGVSVRFRLERSEMRFLGILKRGWKKTMSLTKVPDDLRGVIMPFEYTDEKENSLYACKRCGLEILQRSSRFSFVSVMPACLLLCS